MKKFLTFILVLAMVLSVSGVALAVDQDPCATAPCTHAASIGTAHYDTLQGAIDAAVDGNTITLLTDCAENVTVVQKENVEFTMDGAGKTMTGTITVDGKSAAYETAGLTIKNFIFNTAGISGDTCISLGVDGDNNTRYTNHVTVEKCTFKGSGEGVAAIRSHTGGCKNLTVIGCTVEAGMHSLLQVAGVAGLVVDNCTVNSKNGINLNSSSDVEIKNSNIAVKGYALRIGAGSGGDSGDVELTNNTLATDNSEGDAAIVVRGAAVTNVDLDMTNNRVSGDTHISGNTSATKISANANYWDGDAAPKTSGTAVAVDSYYSDAALENLVAPGAVAKIDTETFETLDAAIAAAQNGDTITLIDDITLTAKVSVSKEVTLDLNGCTISGNVNDDYGMIYIGTAGKLTIKATGGGAITNNGGIAVGNYGIVTVEGGTITGAPALYNMNWKEGDGTVYGTAVINGGEFNGTDGESIWNAGVLTVNAGADVNDLLHSTAKLVIYGGDFEDVGIYTPDYKPVEESASITGGTFNSVVSEQGEGGDDSPLAGFISGGTFSEKPAAELVATDKVALPDDNSDRYVIGDKQVGTSIHAAPASLDFGSAEYGYVAIPAQQLIITNDGTEEVTLAEAVNAAYDFAPAIGGIKLASGESKTVMVAPKTGLSVGTYNATITVAVAEPAASANVAAVAATTESVDVNLKFEVTAKPRDSIKVKYEGGNSFSTSKSAVPTSVEIDGVPVSFTGNGKFFTVGCIDPGAKWVTVRWNSTSVTVNFKPDVTVSCPVMSIPKTGDMPVWAAIAEFFGF